MAKVLPEVDVDLPISDANAIKIHSTRPNHPTKLSQPSGRVQTLSPPHLRKESIKGEGKGEIEMLKDKLEEIAESKANGKSKPWKHFVIFITIVLLLAVIAIVINVAFKSLRENSTATTTTKTRRSKNNCDFFW